MSEYSVQLLDRLKSDAEKRGLKYLLEAPSEFAWTIEALRVRPGNKTWYGVEGDRMMALGIIFVPEPARKHSNTAWNRIEEPSRSKLIKLENDG
jgi:hypothetical protein